MAPKAAQQTSHFGCLSRNAKTEGWVGCHLSSTWQPIMYRCWTAFSLVGRTVFKPDLSSPRLLELWGFFILTLTSHPALHLNGERLNSHWISKNYMRECPLGVFFQCCLISFLILGSFHFLSTRLSDSWQHEQRLQGNVPKCDIHINNYMPFWCKEVRGTCWVQLTVSKKQWERCVYFLVQQKESCWESYML